MVNHNKTESRVPRDQVARARERSRQIKGRATGRRFVICINSGGYVDDLKVRTVYQSLPDDSAAKSNYIRIIDELLPVLSCHHAALRQRRPSTCASAHDRNAFEEWVVLESDGQQR